MNIDDILHPGRGLTDRLLCNAVARKLELPSESVSIARWAARSSGDGSTVPVFRMPDAFVARAEALGLQAEGWSK